jgi:4-hydroxy-tetrahydrodipicolinate synthase
MALWRACAIEGNFDKGRRIMSAMMPLMRVLEQGGKFIQCVKHGCEMMGQYAGPPRPPLRPLNKDDKRQLEQVVRVLKRTVAAIEAEIETGHQAEAAQ